MEEPMKNILSLLFLLLMMGNAVAQNRMADQLRKAIVEEEANQNLNGAIQTYNAILAQYDEQRLTAATALFHLADCYRKQGKSEQAIAAYKRVVREFPEQTKLADTSRNYLISVYKIQPERINEPQKETLAMPEPPPTQQLAQFRMLTEEHIKLVESQIQDAEKRYRNGTASSSEVFELKKELIGLKMRLASISDPAAMKRK
jgi:tetratricopeptide (TPR) repeat protein